MKTTSLRSYDVCVCELFHTLWLMSIADWSKPLGGFTASWMSRAGSRGVSVAMCDCGNSTTSQTRPVSKHRFSALRIDKKWLVEAQIGLLWRSFCSSSHRV